LFDGEKLVDVGFRSSIFFPLGSAIMLQAFDGAVHFLARFQE
jgi:hypothetical protein